MISVNDIDLEVHIAGPVNGPAVFLLHGFPDAWFGWEPQINALAAAGYRVIAPNQRGYGKSSKPGGQENYLQPKLVQDILNLADHLGVDQFYLAGHDFGGMVSWNMAVLHPERIKKMAILNVPHPLAFAQYAKRHKSQRRKSWYFRFFQLPWLPERLVSMRNFAGLKRNMPSMDKSLLRRYVDSWAEPGAIHGMINWYRGLVQGVRKRVIDYSDPISVPISLIWGQDDQFLEVGLAHASKEKVPHAELHLLDASHWVMFDQADEVNRLLIDFFRE